MDSDNKNLVTDIDVIRVMFTAIVLFQITGKGFEEKTIGQRAVKIANDAVAALKIAELNL